MAVAGTVCLVIKILVIVFGIITCWLTGKYERELNGSKKKKTKKK